MIESVLISILIAFVCCQIYLIILLDKILRQLRKLSKEEKKSEPEKEADDELFYSVEFGMVLDDAIRPLLGSYSNKDIIARVVTIVMEHYPKIKFKHDKLYKHIEDVLSNYNNNYRKDIDDEFIGYDNDEIVEYYKRKKDNTVEITPEKSAILHNYNPTVNLSNTLNNFYNE